MHEVLETVTDKGIKIKSDWKIATQEETVLWCQYRTRLCYCSISSLSSGWHQYTVGSLSSFTGTENYFGHPVCAILSNLYFFGRKISLAIKKCHGLYYFFGSYLSKIYFLQSMNSNSFHFFLTNAQIIWWIYDGIYSHIWNGSMIWQGQELVCVDRKVFLWDGPWLCNKHAPYYWLPFHVEGAISSFSFQQQTFQGKYKTVYWLRICIISIWRKKAKRIRKKIFSDKY